LTGRRPFGGWTHTYSAPTTDSPRFLGPVNCPLQTPNCPLVNEQGGSGTLNDGLKSTNTDDNQLLIVGTDSADRPFTPTITLRLAATVQVKEIRIFGGDNPTNFIPGLLDGATVTIGGNLATLATVPAGNTGPLGTQFDDVVDLRVTPLAAVAANEVVLTDFTADAIGLGQFSITEIEVDDGAAEAVTAAEVCRQTHEFVSSSERYQALPQARRAAIDALAAAACAQLDSIQASLTPAQKAKLVARYKRAVDALASQGWLTPDQAATLKSLADRI
jgi:hypothetical protein